MSAIDFEQEDGIKNYLNGLYGSDQQNEEEEDNNGGDELADGNGQSPSDIQGTTPQAQKVPEANTLASPAPVQSQGTASAPLPLEDEKTKAIQDDLMQKYAKAGDDSAVKAAQSEADRKNFVANIGEGLEGLARANSMAHGGAGVNTGFYKGIRDEGRQGVEFALANQKNAINNFMQTHELTRQVLQDKMAQGSYEDQHASSQIAQSLHDPNSQASLNAQQSFRAMFKAIPEIAKMNLDGFSAYDLGEASKNADILMKIKSARDMANYLHQERQGRIDQAHDLVNQRTAEKDSEALGKDLDSQSASTRTGVGQAQGKVNTANRVLRFIDVKPEEITAAQSDPQARAALVAKLDKLDPKYYAEVVTGLMSTIAPGAGSFGQLEALKADTASQTKANVQAWLDSNPHPANMGQFLMNNIGTLQNEIGASQSVLDKHQSEMRAKHPYAFAHPMTSRYAEQMMETFRNQAAEPSSNAPAKSGTSPLPSDPTQLKVGGVYQLGNGQAGAWNGKSFDVTSSAEANK